MSTYKKQMLQFLALTGALGSQMSVHPSVSLANSCCLSKAWARAESMKLPFLLNNFQPFN